MTLPDPSTLRTFFGGHFYQSFDAEYGRISAALWQTLNECDGRDLEVLIDEITAALADDPSEEELMRWYDQMWLGVYPPGRGDGPTHRQFLEWVRHEAEQELARHTSPPGEGPPVSRPMLDTWTHLIGGSLGPLRGRDRITALLTHGDVTIEVLIAADHDNRPAEVLTEDHWLLCLDGMLTIEVDADRQVLGREDILAVPAGTRFHMTAARPDSRWLRIRLPHDPTGPTQPDHPGAIL